MSSFINWNTWPHAVQMNQMLWLNHLYYFSLYEKKETLGPIPYSVLIPLSSSGSGKKPGWSSLTERGSLHTPPVTACICGKEKGMWQGVLFGLQITLPLTRCLFSLLVNQPVTYCFRGTLRDQGSSGRTEMTLWSRQDQLLAGVSSGL